MGRPPKFPLQGRVRVDPEDAHLLERSWYEVRTAYTSYAARDEGGRTVLLHRVIMQTPKGLVVDHLDGNGLNCTRNNMRNCTQSQNILRAYPKGGVRKRWKGWEASLRGQHLGTFETQAEAEEARRVAWEEAVG